MENNYCCSRVCGVAWAFRRNLAGIQALDLVAISSHLQVVSSGLHGDVSRHFSSRAPGHTLQVEDRLERLSGQVAAGKRPGCFRAAYTARSGSQSSTPK
ncbi:hypothetical protein AVEN_142286-1 [Araneus ventricosus]|uniref:Uncharacterized protein n=1 Tax=Araneus ventricosus TaxID=182803 RepID=A0A4Y2MZ98_ARAVE|nr:hypothetical protein AVEN_142286-1 [Araneus ventricosus]